MASDSCRALRFDGLEHCCHGPCHALDKWERSTIRCARNRRVVPESSAVNRAIGYLWMPLSTTPLLWLAVTTGAYFVGRQVQRSCRDVPLASPVLIAILLVAAVVLATGTS